MKLNCKDITSLISKSMDERLPFRQRLFVKVHLLICKGCRSFQVHLSAMRQALRQTTGGLTTEQHPMIERLDSDARQRIEIAIARVDRAQPPDQF